MSRQERLMRPEEVAAIYDVKPETVAEWARTGKIAATRTPGGKWRIYASAVETTPSSTDCLPCGLPDDPALVVHDSKGGRDFNSAAAEVST